ncbi:MAG: peptidase domain-containing ABC transporter [Solirubrobacteraceae bacterium]|nr:peptidase domain-containing ABC transporter [Solirubrobacteraceae bacterium]
MSLRRRHRRVPVLLQHSTNECAAACLAMVLTALGRSTTIEECVLRVGGGRDGASGRVLVEAARGLGALPTAYSLRTADLSGLALPAIVHWEFDHFLVVERATTRWVDVVDPALGRRRLSREEFSRGFTGVAVVLLPGPSMQDGASAVSDSRWAFLRLAGRAPLARRLFAQLIGAAVLLQLLSLAPPFAILLVLDTVVPLSLDDIFPLAAFAIAALLLGQLAAALARSGILIALGARVDTQMTMSAFDHLLSLPYAFFERRSSGDTVMRLMSTATIRQVLGTQALGAVLDGLVAIGYTIVLLLIDVRIGLVAIALALIQVCATVVTGRMLAVRVERELADQAKAQSYLVEAVSGIATIKATGAETRALERFSTLFARQLRSGLARSQVAAAADAVSSGLRLVAPLTIIWFGAQSVIDGSLSAGTMIAVAIVGGLLINGASAAAAAVAELQLGRGMVDRLMDLLRQESEQDRGAVKPAPQLDGAVELRDVTVRYSPSSAAALSGVSLRIESGQKVAIVGASGSGKSTLAKVVLGLIEPEDGDVLVDGVPIDDYDLTTVRRQFGVVLQDSTLFDASIRENIAFHAPDAPLERVVQAAERAHVRAEIEALPMGFDTKVAEGGRSLSGGQRQRLILARALIREPRLLVLDEATSHLDALSEAAVDDLLSRLSCTRVVIAHRLSTVRNADTIVVLDEGRVVEQGSHEQLLAGGDLYARLLGVPADRARNGSQAVGPGAGSWYQGLRSVARQVARKTRPAPDVRSRRRA